MKYGIALALLLASHLQSQELDAVPIMQRLLNISPKFLDSAEVRTEPAPIAGDTSQVLVLFRLSERGSVMDARAVSGSELARRSALSAIRTWEFKPTLLRGLPVEMMSGAVFDFSQTPVHVQAPMPMPANQISPVLSARCYLAITNKAPDIVMICAKEAAAVARNPAHTAMDALSAHDESGVALLLFDQNPRAAIEEFTRAIELAPMGLRSKDGEWAQLYWHRGAAEQRGGQVSEAYRDFSTAERSLRDAAVAVPAGSGGYNKMLQRLIAQHASLLETEGKHDDALALTQSLDR
jgi:hypothetical protein